MESSRDYTTAIIQYDALASIILETMLRNSGYHGEIIKFTDIQTAVNYWDQNTLPQMVITDYFLDEQTDFVLLEYLKAKREEGKRVVVVLAVFMLTKSSPTCKYYGIDYCYGLPIKQEDLNRIIELYKIAS